MEMKLLKPAFPSGATIYSSDCYSLFLYSSFFLNQMRRSNRLRLLIFEQCEGAGKVCMCLLGDADCKCSPQEWGGNIMPLDLRQTFLRSACTLTAPRHPAGGANVSLSQHHSSASRSYLYLEATRCPRQPSAKYHVLFAQTGIIVGTKSICSNTVSLSKCSPR